MPQALGAPAGPQQQEGQTAWGPPGAVLSRLGLASPALKAKPLPSPELIPPRCREGQGFGARSGEGQGSWAPTCGLQAAGGPGGPGSGCWGGRSGRVPPNGCSGPRDFGDRVFPGPADAWWEMRKAREGTGGGQWRGAKADEQLTIPLGGPGSPLNPASSGPSLPTGVPRGLSLAPKSHGGGGVVPLEA